MNNIKLADVLLDEMVVLDRESFADAKNPFFINPTTNPEK